MADEKSSDPTPGSDPASPREPEQVPEDTAADGTPVDDADDAPVADGAADRTAARALSTDQPAGPTPADDADDEAPAEDVGRRTAARAMRPDGAADVEPTDDELSGVDELRRDDGSAEPELAGVSASRRPVRRDRAQEAAGSAELATRKGRATRRRDDTGADADPGRTNPVTFVNESVGELRKVVWPTAEQMRTYFVVVLVFVVFMIAVTSLLDLLFGWALLQVFR